MSYTDHLETARIILGSYEAIGRVCGITGAAVRKWGKKGHPPRTEYSGETNYAAVISKATKGQVKVIDLKPRK